MRYEMDYPLDPKCPEAIRVMNDRDCGFEDPMTQHYGCYDVIEDLYNERAARHRRGCRRCQEYGAANCDVIEVG